MGQTRVNIITLLTLRNKPRKYISQVIGFAEQNCYYKLDKGTLSLGQISKIAKSLNSEAIPIMTIGKERAYIFPDDTNATLSVAELERVAEAVKGSFEVAFLLSDNFEISAYSQGKLQRIMRCS